MCVQIEIIIYLTVLPQKQHRSERGTKQPFLFTRRFEVLPVNKMHKYEDLLFHDFMNKL